LAKIVYYVAKKYIARKFFKMIDQNKNYKEVKKMITTYEEKGIEKAIEKGMEISK